MSPPAIQRLEAGDLDITNGPHRSRSFKLSTDPFFVEKVRDIVSIYLDPPDKALVLCVLITSTATYRPDSRSNELIADNYGTHKHAKVKAWLARHPRYHLHYTPTYASWLNQVVASGSGSSPSRQFGAAPFAASAN